MNIERMISEYENELASLKSALKKIPIEEVEKRIRFAAEITEIEEVIEDLKQQKERNSKNKYE